MAVAIVQGGVAGPEEVKQFYALGSLYREPLWVFDRGDKRLERPSQLAGKRIGTGPPGSGTYAIAMQLLKVNGLIESRPSQEDSRSMLNNPWSALLQRQEAVGQHHQAGVVVPTPGAAPEMAQGQ